MGPRTEAALSGSQDEGDKEKGQLVQSLQGPDQELGMCSQGEGKHGRALGRELCSGLPLERTLWK